MKRKYTPRRRKSSFRALSTRIVIALAALVITVAAAATVPAVVRSHIVSGEDYRGLAYISAKYGADWRCVAVANGVKAPKYAIRKGQTLTIPDHCLKGASALAGKPKAEERREAARVVAEKGETFRWIPNSDRYTGTALVAAKALGVENPEDVARRVGAGNYETVYFGCDGTGVGKDGTEYRFGGAMMHGKNKVLKKRPVHVVCEDNPKYRTPVKVYTGGFAIAEECGNPVPLISKPRPPVPPPAEVGKFDRETGLSCQMIANSWLQGNLDGTSIAASQKMGCLFEVHKNGQLGPIGVARGGRWWPGNWREDGWIVGLGGEYRLSPAGKLEAVEVDVIAGPAGAGGEGGLTKKTWTVGLDAEVSAQIRARLPKVGGVETLLRVMPAFRWPLTGNQADIVWNGRVVGAESARKPILTLMTRFEWERADWKVNPELTIGGWYVFDVVDPWGVKILVGFSTKDKVWRVGVGAQYAGGGWTPVAEVEYNPILGKLYLSAIAADDRLTQGAVPSAEALGVVPAKTPKPRGDGKPARNASASGSGRSTIASDVDRALGIFDGSDAYDRRSARVRDPEPSTPEERARTERANNGPFNEHSL